MIKALITLILIGQQTKCCFIAKVDRILDGDTFTATVDLGFDLITRQGFRLMNYNAPETKGEEKPKGKIAHKALIDLLDNHDSISLRVHSRDAFGRWLVDVLPLEGLTFDGYPDAAAALVGQGFGVRWDGTGKRPRFSPDSPYPLGVASDH